MIYDKISNWKTYFHHPIFAEIFKTLETYSLATDNGVYKYDGGFYFKVMAYDTKPEANIIETHRKEVDIQILLAGEEKIKMYLMDDVEVSTPYNDETDCVFYKNTGTPYADLILKPKHMAVFFPEDPHHPQFQVGNQAASLKKIVIKVDLDLFK